MEPNRLDFNSFLLRQMVKSQARFDLLKFLVSQVTLATICQNLLTFQLVFATCLFDSTWSCLAIFVFITIKFND